MRIERTVSNYNEVGYLVDFEYESYEEMVECIAHHRGWDYFDYNTDDSGNCIELRVWEDDEDSEDGVTIYIVEDEEEYRLLENLEYGEEYRLGYDEEEEYDYDDEEEED